jgi:hypothetical protein
MRRSAVLIAIAAASLPLAACSASDLPGVGGDDSGTKEGKAARAAVERFALAAGPEACDMLSPAALRNVYGAKEPAGPPRDISEPPPPISLAECRRRAPRFSGQKVQIEKVDVLGDARAAKVEATTDGGSRAFTVTVRRKGAATWLIDEIREK